MEHIYFIPISSNTLSPIWLHYLTNEEVLKRTIILWHFLATDHGSNMTNIILPKIPLRHLPYTGQRNNLFFLAIESNSFSQRSSAALKAVTWHKQPARMTIQSLLLSCQVLFLPFFSFWNYSLNTQQGWIFCGVFKQKKKSMKWRS